MDSLVAGTPRSPSGDTTRASRIRLEYLFLVVALVWGGVQALLVPPLQVPDEGDHFFRAWALSNGQLTADRAGTVTIPGSLAPVADLYTGLVGTMGALPLFLDGHDGFSGYEALFGGPETPEDVHVVSRVSGYGPLGYVPQATGIGIGRLAGANPLTSFYLARLANLLVAVALVFFAIRLAPFGKQLYLLLGLLPMTMYEFASVSLDAMTIAGAMFFVALVMWSRTRARLHGAELAVVLLTAALLLTIKPGYWALVLLVLLLRPAQLGGRGRHAVFVGLAGLLVAGVALALFLATKTGGGGAIAGGPLAQLQFILTQPLAFGAVLAANIQRNGLVWMLESIGALGWLNVRLPVALYLFVSVVGIGFVFRMKEDVDLEVRERAVLAAVGIAVFLTMAVALYAFLEPLGSGRIYFQGRYLAPVWLVLLLSVYGIRFAPRRIGMAFISFALIVIMVESLRTLAFTYYP